jgi:hypothetical protein
MKRVAAAVVAVVLGAAAVAPAAADWRSSDRGVTRSSDARAARARIEQRLSALQAPRPLEVEYSTPYLPYVEGDRGVDQQIRRLGELIRRQQPSLP